MLWSLSYNSCDIEAIQMSLGFSQVAGLRLQGICQTWSLLVQWLVRIFMCKTAKSTEICSCDTKQLEVLMGMVVNCIHLHVVHKQPCVICILYLYAVHLYATISRYTHICLSKGIMCYQHLAECTCMDLCFKAANEAAFSVKILLFTHET